MAKHNDVGVWGERAAEEYYVSQGYAIRERNWRLNHLEMDLIVTRGRTIAFVEVKTRTSDIFADPIDAVTPRKRQHMVDCADTYMRLVLPRELELDWRFDVILVVGTPDNYKLEHIPDAFFPKLRRFFCRR